MTEERVHILEYRSIESMHLRNGQNLRDTWNNIKVSIRSVIGVQKEMEQNRQKMFEEIISLSFLNLMKDINLYIQGYH